MLLLEGVCRSVSHCISEFLTRPLGDTTGYFRLNDFHNSKWEVYFDEEAEVIYVGISMYISRGKLKKWGLEKEIERVYGADCVVDEEDFPDYMQESPDVVVSLKDKNEWRSETLTKGDREKLQDICDKYASLYKVCMTPAFSHHFDLFNAGEPFDPVKIGYRKSESMYIRGTKDNCAIYTSMVFDTDEDLLYGRLFLQEMADAKKHKKNLAAAPSCSISVEIPKGLEETKTEAEGSHRLWVVLNLFTKHTNTKDKDHLDKTVEILLSFCNHMRYHISCSHAYLHSRMRSRHTSLLQVLNRAKTQQTDHVSVQID